MNDDLDEPQFEHEEPAAQKKKRTKNGCATTTTTTPRQRPILEESAQGPNRVDGAGRAKRRGAREEAEAAARRRRRCRVAAGSKPLPDADAAAAGALAPPKACQMAVRAWRGQQGRAVDVVVVCTPPGGS